MLLAARYPALPDSTALSGTRRLPLHPVIPVLLLWLVLLALNPVGYMGGGGDDRRYLEAARCVVAERQWCIPAMHWAARWPVVLPLAGAIATFGETRLATGLSSMAWTLAATILLVAIARRWAGDVAAVLAGSALILTPVFTLASLRPNADIPELALLLGALLATLRGKLFVAGLLLGLAITTRETAGVALVAVAAACAWRRPAPVDLIRGMAGLVAPIAIEALWYGVTASDPLLRAHVALAHTTIASTELEGAVDPRLPLLNTDIVSRWRPAMGIHVHWVLDPLLNLVAHPKCGMILAGAAGLLAAGGRRVAARAWFAAIASAAISLALIFILAVDPKPRMFMAAVAAASLIAGMESARRLRENQAMVPLVLFGLLTITGVATVARQPNLLRAEAVAAGWLATPPPGLVVDAMTARHLGLVDAVRRLPVGSTTPRLTIETGDCAGPVLRATSIYAADPPVTAALRATGVLLGPRKKNSLCLYR